MLSLRFMRSAAFAVFASVICLALPFSATAQVFDPDVTVWDDVTDWFAELKENPGITVAIGAGYGIIPDFPGSDEFKDKALPLFQIKYKDRLILDPRGARMYAWRNSRTRFKITLGFSDLRSAEAGSPVALLPGVARGGSIGGILDWRIWGPFVARVNARHGFAGGHEAATVATSLSIVIREKGKFAVVPEVAATFAENKYMDAFYSVTPSGAALSGLDAFDAAGGLRDVAIRLSGIYHFNAHWSIMARAERSRLFGDAGRSSIVRQAGSRTQGMAGVAVLYTF